jgi:precorrin-2 dehydrogenase/sirohydrochlorin ferrochelatase
VNYPINLDLNKKKVLIIGGGKVALRKIKRLIYTGANIRIISPEIRQSIFEIIQTRENTTYCNRKFIEDDINNGFLIIAATDKTKINREIGQLARDNNRLVNVVDSQKLSNFTLPSVITRGDFLLTISTGGNFPGLSKVLRKKLELEFGEEYEFFLELMGQIRELIKERVEFEDKRRKIFCRLANLEIVKLFKNDRVAGFEAINKILWDEFDLKIVIEHKNDYKILKCE